MRSWSGVVRLKLIFWRDVFFVGCLVLSGAFGCTSTKPSSREPISNREKHDRAPAKVSARETGGNAVVPPAGEAEKNPRSEPSEAATGLPPDTCAVLEKLATEPPAVVEGKGLVLTRMQKPCVTRDGRRGFEKNSAFTAMGVPCTGGEGLIDWKGTNYQRPRFASFIIATDCVMQPADTNIAKEIIKNAFALPQESNLIAYSPFTVQYWEIPSLTEGDTGFTVDLRTNEAVEKTWPRMLKGEVLRVKLFGRENSWGSKDTMYEVDGDLVISQKNRFRLQLVGIQALKTSDVEAVRIRCEALKPRRNCTVLTVQQ